MLYQKLLIQQGLCKMEKAWRRHGEGMAVYEVSLAEGAASYIQGQHGR